MSDPPSALKAREAAKNIQTMRAEDARCVGIILDFIDHHDGCKEREAQLVLTIEEQQRELDILDDTPHEEHW